MTVKSRVLLGEKIKKKNFKIEILRQKKVLEPKIGQKQAKKKKKIKKNKKNGQNMKF